MSKKNNRPARRQPQRTCIVCRSTSDKRTLVRIVRSAAGVKVDERGKVPGRGAYLCHQASCWHSALKDGVLRRALNTSLTDTELDELEAYSGKVAVRNSTPVESSP